MIKMEGRKRGRPRKKGGTKERKHLRKIWRECSARYYRANRDIVLRRAMEKGMKEGEEK